MSRLWDISPLVSPELEGWAGDTRFEVTRRWSQANGDSVTVSRVTMSTHLGAHVDAPLHYVPGGADAASMPLDPFLGPARVIRLPRAAVIDRAAALRATGAERALFSVLQGSGEEFPKQFPTFSTDAAQALVDLGVVLVGTDAPSVDPVDSKTLDAHRILYAGGVAILEGLALDVVPEGNYELIALPLRWKDVDGSPVRAILRQADRIG